MLLALLVTQAVGTTAKKMLGKSARVIILVNNGSTHEVLRDCILLREISRAEQRGQHRSSFSGASLSPYRVTPDTNPHAGRARYGGNESNLLPMTAEIPESSDEGNNKPKPSKMPTPKRGAIPTPKAELEKAKRFIPETDSAGDKK